MLARTPDRFEEWLRAPAPGTCADPRFEVRRALPSEFETIYDLVDEAFGTRRSRAFCDWLYRRNPGGLARCWVLIEKSAGRMIATSAEWPWPTARGSEMLDGVQRGDWAIAPRWQRQGVNQLRARVKQTHAWRQKTLAISWPNEKLRAGARKRGGDWKHLGPMRRQVAVLRSEQYLVGRGCPRPLATAAGAAATAILEGWWRIRLRGQRFVTIEEVRRFDSSFDAVTERHMCWDLFWCPHDAEFLNWRYLDHPTRTYLAFAALTGDQIAGYAVVGVAEDWAWLMELVAPRQPVHVAGGLLHYAFKVARGAGCTRLDFFATPGWPHWPLLAAAGFLDRPSELFLEPVGPYEPEIYRLENWQCVPGDTDFL